MRLPAHSPAVAARTVARRRIVAEHTHYWRVIAVVMCRRRGELWQRRTFNRCALALAADVRRRCVYDIDGLVTCRRIVASVRCLPMARDRLGVAAVRLFAVGVGDACVAAGV